MITPGHCKKINQIIGEHGFIKISAYQTSLIKLSINQNRIVEFYQRFK